MKARRFLLLAMLLAPAAEAKAAPLWGAIASSYDTQTHTGYVSEKSRYDALIGAVASCRRMTRGQDCFAVAAVQDACLAWAIDLQGHWGWGQMEGTAKLFELNDMAQKKAIEHCLINPDNAPGNCRVVRTLCTEEYRPIPLIKTGMLSQD